MYILQGLGVLLLLLCYLLRDQPDRLSLMHFNSASRSVIKKDSRSMYDVDRHEVKACSTHNGGRQKTDTPKHIPLEPMMPQPVVCLMAQHITVVQHDAPLYRDYHYLFYEEINPPPPKC